MAEEQASPPARGSSAESVEDGSPGKRDLGSHRLGWLTLRRRVTGALLIVALVPLFGVSLLTYQREQSARTEDAVERLLAVAVVQEARIETNIAENFSVDLPSSLARTELLRLLSIYLETGGQADRATLGNEVRLISESSTGFHEILIVDFDGIVITASTVDRVGTDLSGNENVTGARYGSRLGGWSLADNGDLIHTVAGPLLVDGVPGAILVIEGEGQGFRDPATDYTGLGETGETILAIRDEGGDAVFITPVRFDPDAAFSRRVPRTAPMFP